MVNRECNILQCAAVFHLLYLLPADSKVLLVDEFIVGSHWAAYPLDAAGSAGHGLESGILHKHLTVVGVIGLEESASFFRVLPLRLVFRRLEPARHDVPLRSGLLRYAGVMRRGSSDVYGL